MNNNLLPLLLAVISTGILVGISGIITLAMGFISLEQLLDMVFVSTSLFSIGFLILIIDMYNYSKNTVRNAGGFKELVVEIKEAILKKKSRTEISKLVTDAQEFTDLKNFSMNEITNAIAMELASCDKVKELVKNSNKCK